MRELQLKGSSTAVSAMPMAQLGKGRVSRILVWAAGLGVGWIALIQGWAPSISQPQNQFVGNVAEAEQFIYGSGPIPAIVAGSSMVDSFDALTNGRLQVLSMNGMSAREALIILLRSGRVPQQVAVELNALTALPNDAFVDRVFNPFWLPIRRSVLALRTEYQPASVIMSLAKDAFGRGAHRRSTDVAPDTVAELRIAQLTKFYQQPPDMVRLRASLMSVRDSVDELERRGARVTFFEYPVPHGLANTPFHLARRAANVEILGPRAQAAIRFEDDNFQTRDGIHLVPKDHQTVAKALEAMLLDAAGDTVEP